MPRHSVALIVIAFGLSGTAPAEEPTTRFDAGRLSLRLVGDDWQLRHGDEILKHFGRSYAEAQETLRLIHTNRLDSYGTLGSPGTFEYWLREGEAPAYGDVRGRPRIFDLKTLELREYQRIWHLADENGIVFNFGPDRDAATQALAICRKHRFNVVVTLGSPTPQVMFLLSDPSPIAIPSGRRLPEQGVALAHHAELTRNMLMLPNIGCVGQRVSVRTRDLDVRRIDGEWRLLSGPTELARFGTSISDARDAEELLRGRRVTEICPVGKTDVRLLLSSGQVRRGSPPGADAVRFDPDRLAVAPAGDGWNLNEDGRRVIALGPDREGAELLLAVIRHYGFDEIAHIGGRNGGFRFLAKSR